MNRRSNVLLLLPLLFLSGCVSTSFTGDYVVPAGHTLRGDLVATSGSVILERDSNVTGTIVLTSGELFLGENAQVGKNVVLTSGDVHLADGAVVHGDMILANQEIGVDRDPGSRVDGAITSNIAAFVVSAVTQALLLYCLLPAVLLAAVVFGVGALLGRGRRHNAPAPPQGSAPAVEKKLLELKSLLDQGLITEADYQAKKEQLLAQM